MKPRIIHGSVFGQTENIHLHLTYCSRLLPWNRCDWGNRVTCRRCIVVRDARLRKAKERWAR